MMRPFSVYSAVAAPFPRRDVDTDQIIPKQFLKRIERTGFGDALFFDWRRDPLFFLNDSRFAGAGILLAGSNFGCGSSREHAAWALFDAGFRAILAPSFADIFAANCVNNGIAALVLTEDRMAELMARAEQGGYKLTVDLELCQIRDEDGFTTGFDIDAFRRRRLLGGLDEIALTLEYETAIESYEHSVLSSRDE